MILGERRVHQIENNPGREDVALCIVVNVFVGRGVDDFWCNEARGSAPLEHVLREAVLSREAEVDQLQDVLFKRDWSRLVYHS